MNPSGTTGAVLRGLEIVGDLLASEDLTIQGNFDGQITMPDHHLSIDAGSSVKGKVVARTVTIGGTLDGSILAPERIELTPTAIVRAHLTTARIMLADGATFQGTIDPKRTEAAMAVARFRGKRSTGDQELEQENRRSGGQET
jgi:cytoskeletal protein CcmA (bactofilin family)